MDYVAIIMGWDDDYLGFVQSEKLFTQTVIGLGNTDHCFLFVIDRTILERMCKLNKMMKKTIR